MPKLVPPPPPAGVRSRKAKTVDVIADHRTKRVILSAASGPVWTRTRLTRREAERLQADIQNALNSLAVGF
jgi:hypothetical protein